MLKAFTLIELLTVLAVIAILLTIVTSFAVNAVHQARATRVAMNLRNIRAAAESYVSVEKPPTQTNFDLNFLVSKSYLTSVQELAHYTLCHQKR
ncbi:N-terminal cleavage protein [Pseudothermotoga hypogea DSM 11164 = NBRC 106472]|uniref:N-terminal cleavage protein n=2 Tax=Pseudothermotoga TaxID=1643951 RepID=A0A0X1KS90_9THEM|nr:MULTISPECIES: type II secretion system protein [Pseudothermotoga]AJC74054.1 N-terminal cleavage protein [Pseudothermotoga hypogea DSM 11164 = NBRC 106472]MDI6862899.1 type II secretion system protein [Pseudothermotoga sp.]